MPSRKASSLGVNVGISALLAKDSTLKEIKSDSIATRLQRNQAEKVRRDKLTNYVNELASLLPMVPPTGKKPHRTNVLRHAAAFLRNTMIANEILINSNMLPVTDECWDIILEGMEGIVLVITSSGKIVYFSKGVESLLGHQQHDLNGLSLFNFTYPDDYDTLKENLRYDPTEISPCGLSARRSFSIRLRQRAASKGDQPHFEPVHIAGHIRVPQYPPTPSTSKEVALLGQASGPSQEPTFIGVVTPFKEMRVTDTSLLEANRDEWFSRHLIDGKIIYSDHRISYSSGYLAEEVTGFHAFKYMHKDDVRWVLIALRQMYLHGEAYGSSCYRLQIKTGKFMYLKTRGYLESCDSNSVHSFICVNTPVSEAEGQKLMLEMQKQLAPLLEKEPELSISALIDQRNKSSTSKNTETLDDPEDLNRAIEQLLANVPVDEIRAQPSSSAPDEFFEKAATVSKALPPAIVQSSQVGVSPPSMKKINPSTPQPQQRPSVLRFNSTEKAKRGVNEDQAPSGSKRPRPTHTSVIVSEPLTRSTVTSVIQANTSPTTPVRQSFVPLHVEDTAPIEGVIDESFIFPAEVFVGNSLDPTVDLPLQFQDFSGDYSTTLQVPVVEGDEVLLSSLLTSDAGQLEVNVMQGHQQLEDSIEKQVRQIISIEHDLASVPPYHTNKYRNTLSHLKAEHRKQNELLETLQHDRQAIQRPSTSGLNKRQLPLSHQDIGA